MLCLVFITHLATVSKNQNRWMGRSSKTKSEGSRKQATAAAKQPAASRAKPRARDHTQARRKRREKNKQTL